MGTIYGKIHDGECLFSSIDEVTNTIMRNKNAALAGYDNVWTGFSIDIFRCDTTKRMIGTVEGYFINAEISCLCTLEDAKLNFSDEKAIAELDYSEAEDILKRLYENVFVITGGSYLFGDNCKQDEIVTKKIIPGLIFGLLNFRVTHIINRQELLF